MIRFFWLLSDEETVREISDVKYMDLLRLNSHWHRKSYLIGWKDETGVCFTKSGSTVWIPHTQLNQVLGEDKNEALR